MTKRELVSFETHFFLMVSSQGLGLVAVAQQIMVNPEQIWFSWPVVVGLLSLAIYSTYKVTTFYNKVNTKLDLFDKEKKASSNE